MTTTRRTPLRNAGVAAAGSMAFQASARASGAPAQVAPGTEAPSLRSLTYCTLRTAQGDTLGLRREDRILDVVKAGKALRVAVPASTDEVLEGKALAGLQKVLAAPTSSLGSALVPVEQARFGPCITRPQKILMLGFNYRKHAQETGTPIPKGPGALQQVRQRSLGPRGSGCRPGRRRSSITRSSCRSSWARRLATCPRPTH